MILMNKLLLVCLFTMSIIACDIQQPPLDWGTKAAQKWAADLGEKSADATCISWKARIGINAQSNCSVRVRDRVYRLNCYIYNNNTRVVDCFQQTE